MSIRFEDPPSAPPSSQGVSFSVDLSVDSLATAYVIVTNSLVVTVTEQLAHISSLSDPVALHRQRNEVCAMAWAAIQMAAEASTLSFTHRQFILHSLRHRLLPHWHAMPDSHQDFGLWLDERAWLYLNGAHPRETVTRAVRIVEILLEAIGVPGNARTEQTRLLAGLIGHRIISDTQVFNEWEARRRQDSAAPGEPAPAIESVIDCGSPLMP